MKYSKNSPCPTYCKMHYISVFSHHAIARIYHILNNWNSGIVRKPGILKREDYNWILTNSQIVCTHMTWTVIFPPTKLVCGILFFLGTSMKIQI
jgi:hypothetical protein